MSSSENACLTGFPEMSKATTVKHDLQFLRSCWSNSRFLKTPFQPMFMEMKLPMRWLF